MLSDKQLRLIELIISEDYTISQACETVQVPRNTYYDWKKGESKVGKEFCKAFDKALELKVKESRQRVRNNVNSLLDSLQSIVVKGKNENAKVNAVAKLIQYAELDPSNKQELTIKDGEEGKNHLLEKWKEKQQEDKNKEE